MIAIIPFLVAVGIAAGPVLSHYREGAARRWAGAVLLGGLMLAAEFAVSRQTGVMRMSCLCLVLLAGMKGLVYAEWAQGRRLPMSRYLVFALLWFGMDPGSFQTRRKGLEWRGDLRMGLAMMLLGTVGAWWVWKMEWRQVLVMFVPLSLGFHFGALRVLKAALRAAGFPVRTLFPNVLEARGLADFWSRRWNTGYSQMMQRLVGKPVARGFGDDAGLMAVFLGSGLLHELAITLPVRAGYGLPTLYFLIHGLLTLMERRMRFSFGKIPALLAVGLPLGMLFPEAFQSEVIEPCLEVLGWIDAAVRKMVLTGS
ncbi:MAG: membrane bound O-acyl transferase family-domain-containing protein [Akkermansiaceae bacterium]|jgi:alginate O-acetyltransferase complex protein AlgI|nr:membrane bound O-acyl transferase family-domain-containing protein [Akkermansiaceae bacterium]